MLSKNEDGRWELDGRELSCGSAIEVQGFNGRWQSGRVEHDPRWGYFALLDNGNKHVMNEKLDVFRLPRAAAR